MDQEWINEICVSRLQGWLEVLLQHQATPMVLVGVGQDSGQLVVIAAKDLSDLKIKDLLAVSHISVGSSPDLVVHKGNHH